MKKISIIIPMYNSEAYIRQCLNSVRNQTYYNLEILVIDDGSTDKSLKICRDMCQEDNRICLFTQRHAGVSSARNRGLDEATGDYIFFLDSDDMIHPFLLEELTRQMESKGMGLVFCTCKRLDEKEIEKVFYKESMNLSKGEGNAVTIEEKGSEFYLKYRKELSEIGGKLIQRDAIGELRFEQKLKAGEDTLFLYELFCKSIKIVYYYRSWYYYRMRPDSLSHTVKSTMKEQYLEQCRKMRDSAYKREYFDFALMWENMVFYLMKKDYVEANKKGEKEKCNKIKELSRKEKRHPLYKKLSFVTRLIIWSCFYCYPLYLLIDPIYRILEKKCGDVGILTFHCSDNYGAMLQAYGLKQYCNKIGIRAEIVRYEPPFLTGRHWYVPYVPVGGISKMLMNGLGGWKTNLAMGTDFFRLRANMASFREEYLVRKGQKKLRFICGLKKLPYRYYIVGSDQIWNPDITLGLRKAYFGAFTNRRKEKVIAYGASLGSGKLLPKYDRAFGALLQSVDAISLREPEALPYVKKICKRDTILSVIDPVFLLQKEEWQRVEKNAGKKGFIFVYMTEYNQKLLDFARKLARDRKLQIIEVKKGIKEHKKEIFVDNTAGPAEFLGYIHGADYVITNSFHGTAFSIIYEKKFMVFQHSSLGARISNILRIHGLEERLYDWEQGSNIDSSVDWSGVREKTAKQVEQSREFLMENIFG